MEDQSKFLDFRKFPDGVAMIMALLFYLGVNDGQEVKREASFTIRQKINKS